MDIVIRTDEMMFEVFWKVALEKHLGSKLKLKDVFEDFKMWTAERDHVCTMTRTDFIVFLSRVYQLIVSKEATGVYMVYNIRMVLENEEYKVSL